ncbi:hypothetical protein TNCV_3734701 [Trichonephila clavipes]|nr:hypothetical protein TNCV_3734701 [Trichonephila clavipes]
MGVWKYIVPSRHGGHSKYSSNRASSRVVGGRGREVEVFLATLGGSFSKLGWNRVKTYNHLHGAQSSAIGSSKTSPLPR